MNKITVNSDKLLLAITLLSIAVIITYLVLAIAIQNQPLTFPWNETASVGWVSGVTS